MNIEKMKLATNYNRNAANKIHPQTKGFIVRKAPRESYSKPSMSIVQWEGKHSINWKEKQIPTQLYCLPIPGIR